MVEVEGVVLGDLRVLAERVGMHLSEGELVHLKPMFDHYAREIRSLHEVDLGMEDLAVVFSPHWPS